MRFNNPQTISQAELVRDLIFVFQGINGKNITYSTLEDSFLVSPEITLTPSTHKLVS